MECLKRNQKDNTELHQELPWNKWGQKLDKDYWAGKRIGKDSNVDISCQAKWKMIQTII